MPSRAWVVTARMPNILNFSWYFLCIPAIYRCILAHLPIFFNQLSKFLRCESPSTFLGTCLSHHSFIIFLVTNTNTLLSGLYLISTVGWQKEVYIFVNVSMPSRAYNSFLQDKKVYPFEGFECQCPLGLITHFYHKMLQCVIPYLHVSMPSRAYNSFLQFREREFNRTYSSVNALSGL